MLDGNIDPRGVALARIARLKQEAAAAAEQERLAEEARAKKTKVIDSSATVLRTVVLRYIM